MDDSAMRDPSATEAERAAMAEAIDRALRAVDEGGKAGIAATVLCDGAFVAAGENEVRGQSDPTQHAEMVAITRAAATLGRTDLSDCVILSTLQPCEMCLAAIRFAGIGRIVFAARQQNVAGKYFVFPHLKIEDFRNGDDFDAIGGLLEDRVLHLYATGDQ